MPQIAVKVSESAFAKLKRLAHQQHANYATIVEAALSAYEPGASEHASHGASEIHNDLQTLIESALRPVLDRVEALERALAALTGEAAIYPPEPKLAEIGSCAAVEALPENPAVVEKESTPSSPILPLPPIESALKELGQQGHGQQAIAKELNRRGYRTANGTLIQRGYVGNVLKRMGL